MAIVIRISEEEMLGKQYLCGDCRSEFVYGPGFPEYCPECGEEFTATDDEAKESRNRRA